MLILRQMRNWNNNNQPTCPALIEARYLVSQDRMPWAAYQALRSQVHSAKRRGIEFLFTAAEWWDWWQTDDRWSRRGLKDNGLVMARTGDIGPYSPGNVYPCTNAENTQDIDPEVRRAAMQASWDNGRECWLAGQRGDHHPKSRAVETPAGRFGSLALAAEHFGLTRAGAHYRAKRGHPGWSYAD